MYCPKISVLLLATAMASSSVAIADDDNELPFEEARLFFELNDTDGDLGIHGKIDGDEWRRLEIEAPNDRRLLVVNVRGRLRRQGLTELFFESAEPKFDELEPEVFFNRFPEGEYDIEGITLDGEERESEVWLSHVIPAAPDGVKINGIDSASAEVCGCDEDELEPGEVCPEIPEIADAADGVTLQWDPVTQSHAAKHANDDKLALGSDGMIEVRYYEVVVEIDESDFKSSSIVPADVTEWELPGDFFELSDEGEYKYEILVRTNIFNGDGERVTVEIDGEEQVVPGNKTAMESCFVVPVDEDDED